MKSFIESVEEKIKNNFQIDKIEIIDNTDNAINTIIIGSIINDIHNKILYNSISYIKICLNCGSNTGPFAYKANALPLSYKGFS